MEIADRRPPPPPTSASESPNTTHFPINDLPAEILSKIFKHATPHYLIWDAIEPYCWMPQPLSPTAIGSVCRYWRAITLANPILWSTIETHGTTQSTISYIRLCLARSGPFCLIDINYTYPGPNADSQITEDSDLEDVTKVMELLITNISRWRRVKFVFDDPRHYRTLADVPPGSAINLVAADINFLARKGASSQGYLKAWKVFESAPALRELCLHDPVIARPESLFWNRLTSLNLSHGYGDWVLVNIIPHLHSVEEITIQVIHPRIHEDTVTLTKLRYLTICGGSYSIHAFLHWLRAPSLLHLEMQSLDPLDPMSHHLHDFLARSQCNLQSLRIWGHYSDLDLAESLTSIHLRSLEDLDLSGGIGNDIITALTLSRGGEGNCPRLRRIVLSLHTWTDGLLGQCILSRVTGGGCLAIAIVSISSFGTHISDLDKEILSQCTGPQRYIKLRWELRHSDHNPVNCDTFAGYYFFCDEYGLRLLFLISRFGTRRPPGCMEDIETAPALHRLRIGNRSIVQVKAGIWRRLTHLELPSLENLKLMGVLKQSSNLQELRVAVFSHHFPDIVPVLLSNLTDRYIHAQDSMYTPFLRLIEALSLQHLNIHRPRHYINGEVSDLHNFLDFVWRSQCDLRRLALDDAFLSDSGVVKFFGPQPRCNSYKSLSSGK
ncbi:hypothetical protein AX16_004668 [Volvariella volvacea WC 439]|nr:hypothetical protein AX16_004668 [Volvariella volvacea WC 439]